jgi:hypothetical protein
LSINQLLNSVGSQTHEMSLGLAGGDGFSDLEAPFPRARLDLTRVKSTPLRFMTLTSAPTCLSLPPPTTSRAFCARTRRTLPWGFLEGQGSPGEYIFPSAPPWRYENYSREACAIHSRKAFDFMGSSELPTVCTACSAFGHPSQPGNSNTQNSPLDGASAAVISNRHLTRMGRTEMATSAWLCDMMLPLRTYSANYFAISVPDLTVNVAQLGKSNVMQL